ncbi:hypothetical protein [Photobacterium damselae]|uniref:hypothetical protein n=2 Tax=Photobacterium damselae TaxID=38293 RepID=UPI001EDF2A27|nr:hypothetical protein [Photobacterium damselae]MCG3823475.1 hypothetical protein [Photobacterium damselae]
MINNKVMGIMPIVVSDFEYESDTLIEVALPIDVVHLFDSILGEFALDEQLKYKFDEKQSCLLLEIDSNKVFFIIKSQNNKAWSRREGSTSLTVKTALILPKDRGVVQFDGLYCETPYHLANELNIKHDGCRFYIENNALIIECDLYLTHGVTALCIMDVLVNYLGVVFHYTDKLDEQNESCRIDVHNCQAVRG